MQIIAFAAILILGVIIVSVSISPSMTFADVIKPLLEAETFAFDIFIGGEGGVRLFRESYPRACASAEGESSGKVFTRYSQ